MGKNSSMCPRGGFGGPSPTCPTYKHLRQGVVFSLAIIVVTPETEKHRIESRHERRRGRPSCGRTTHVREVKMRADQGRNDRAAGQIVGATGSTLHVATAR